MLCSGEPDDDESTANAKKTPYDFEVLSEILVKPDGSVPLYSVDPKKTMIMRLRLEDGTYVFKDALAVPPITRRNVPGVVKYGI